MSKSYGLFKANYSATQGGYRLSDHAMVVGSIADIKTVAASKRMKFVSTVGRFGGFYEADMNRIYIIEEATGEGVVSMQAALRHSRTR